MLQLVFQHHSVSNFRNISQIWEGSPAYLFNCHVEGNILVKNDSKFSHSLIGNTMFSRFCGPNIIIFVCLNLGEENYGTSRP